MSQPLASAGRGATMRCVVHWWWPPLQQARCRCSCSGRGHVARLHLRLQDASALHRGYRRCLPRRTSRSMHQSRSSTPAPPPSGPLEPKLQSGRATTSYIAYMHAHRVLGCRCRRPGLGAGAGRAVPRHHGRVGRLPRPLHGAVPGLCGGAAGAGADRNRLQLHARPAAPIRGLVHQHGSAVDAGVARQRALQPSALRRRQGAARCCVEGTWGRAGGISRGGAGRRDAGDAAYSSLGVPSLPRTNLAL